MDAEMLRDLEDGVRPVARARAPAERVAVIRAEGRVFCAGLDLRGDLGKDQDVEMLFHRVETWPLPVVAVVQGAAIAGGNELALHCDLVVASTDARFGMSLAQVGPGAVVVPDQEAARGRRPGRDPRDPAARRPAAGAAHGRPRPDRPLRAAPTSCESAAAAIIDRLVRNAPLSLRAMKATINRQMAFRDGIEHADTDDLVRTAMRSADAKEGVRARMDRRDADFTGT